MPLSRDRTGAPRTHETRMHRTRPPRPGHGVGASDAATILPLTRETHVVFIQGVRDLLDAHDRARLDALDATVARARRCRSATGWRREGAVLFQQWRQMLLAAATPPPERTGVLRLRAGEGWVLALAHDLLAEAWTAVPRLASHLEPTAVAQLLAASPRHHRLALLAARAAGTARVLRDDRISGPRA